MDLDLDLLIQNKVPNRFRILVKFLPSRNVAVEPRSQELNILLAETPVYRKFLAHVIKREYSKPKGKPLTGY
jgi:hypothetical protein